LAIELVEGDLTECAVEVIVNPWNRQFLPWWLLRPHGVSGQIKRQGGTAIFEELARYGRLLPGQAVLTRAGKLPYRAIIHVAGIGLLGRSNTRLVRIATRNALALAAVEKFSTLAFPLIGAGSGGLTPADSFSIMRQEMLLREADFKQMLVAIPDPRIIEQLGNPLH
jgi:O-acetyl-ADP-ribose deacetylase (regulator of RNase III)